MTIVRYAGTEYVYKKYSASTLNHLNLNQLETHIRWPNTLDSPTRSMLDSICGWPTYIVERHGKPVGVLVIPAPEKYWSREGGHLSPRSVASIIQAPFDSFDMNFRLRLLGELMEKLLWLHARELVVGDLYYANVLVAGDGSVFLIDMDTSVLRGGCPFDIRYEPAWSKEPNNAAIHTVSSDWFKFGRLVVQIVSRNIAQRELARGEHPFCPRDQLLLLYFARGQYTNSQGILSTVAREWQSTSTTFTLESGRFHSMRRDGSQIASAPNSTKESQIQPSRTSTRESPAPKTPASAMPAPIRTDTKFTVSKVIKFIIGSTLALIAFYLAVLAIAAVWAGLAALLTLLPGDLGEWFQGLAASAEADLMKVWHLPSKVWQFFSSLVSILL